MSVDLDEKIFWSQLATDIKTQCTVFFNLEMHISKGISCRVPLTAIHSSGVYCVCDLSGVDDDSARTTYFSSLQNLLSHELHIPISLIVLYGISFSTVVDDERCCLYQAFYKLRNFNSGINEMLLSDFDIREEKLSADKINLMSNQLQMSYCISPLGNNLKDGVKEINGELFCKRKGKWVQVSDENQNLAFFVVLFGGVFGIHKFRMRKWAQGVGYLLTLSFCGVGWFFDVLEFFIGVAKDQNKRYYLPITGKIAKTICFVCTSVFVIFLIFAYFSTFNNLSDVMVQFVKVFSDAVPK